MGYKVAPILFNMKHEITTTVEVDGEIYIFRIFRDDAGELDITTQANLPKKIQELLDNMLDTASHLL